MQEKLEALRQLDLPLGQYAITGSGPLGVRGLRAMGDVDIIVSRRLWEKLSEKHGILDEDGIRRIPIPGGIVDAMGEGSFYSVPKLAEDPSIEERIAKVDMIEGLPFESLKHLIYFKRRMGRDKDLRDVEMVLQWCQENGLDEIQ